MVNLNAVPAKSYGLPWIRDTVNNDSLTTGSVPHRCRHLKKCVPMGRWLEELHKVPVAATADGRKMPIVAALSSVESRQ